MKRFADNSRVCFLGDSITANGRWIAGVLDHYASSLPQSRVKMYGCGISGGSAVSGLKYLEEDLLPYHPTHAVVMLGMNDISRDLYGRPDTPELLQRRSEALRSYGSRMEEIARILSEKGITLVFCTPTPYDEEQDCPEINLTGCAGALSECGGLAKALASRYGADVIDFNSELTALNHEVLLRDKSRSLIGPDRVHPTEIGHSAMTRIFLRTQGLTDIAPATAETVLSDEVALPLSGKGALWHQTHSLLRTVWSVEWLLLQQLWGKPDAEKLAFIENYRRENPEAAPYFRSISQTYLEQKKNQPALLEQLLRQTDDMYSC